MSSKNCVHVTRTKTAYKKHCSQANSLCQMRCTGAFGVYFHEASAFENRTSAEQAALDMNEDHVSTDVSIYHPIKMHHIALL